MEQPTPIPPVPHPAAHLRPTDGPTFPGRAVPTLRGAP